MAILGSDSGTSDIGLAAQSKRTSKFTLAAPATLTELWTKLTGGAGGSNSVIVHIYADTAGAPSTLIAATNPITVPASAPLASYGQTGFSIVLPAGSYWIGLSVLNTNGTGKYISGTSGTPFVGNVEANYNPPDDPYGSTTTSGSNRIYTAWAVVGPATVAPVAAFSGTPLSGAAPLTVTFTDASTNVPTGWAWTFGDGGSSSVQSPTHEYGAAGTFTVTLTASNAGGSDAETKTGYVTVTAGAAASRTRVQIAFDDNPDVVTPTWTRIDTLAGCRVREWTIDRGRPSEFDKTDTGTATVRIVDRAGIFDPTNPGSPYHSQIVPGKQAAISLQNPVSDEWFTLFRGFVESWTYALDQTRQYMELELQLVDGFAVLARAELIVGEDGALPLPEEIAAGNVAYGETLGSVKDRIDGILGDVGWPVGLRDVFTGNVRVGPKAYGPGTTALDAIWDAVDGEFPGVGNCYISKTGVFTFHGRQARFRPDVAEYGIQRRTVADPSGYDLDPDEVVPLSELEFSNGNDNLFNACTATPQGIGTGTDWRQLDPEQDDIAGQYVKDTTSITAHGLRGLTFDNLQTLVGIASGNDSLEETKLFSEYYVNNYSDPLPRVSRMVFKSRRPGNLHGSALWKHLCKVEISDLLTLVTEHPGGGGFNTEFYVEGIHYSCRPGPPNHPIIELTLDVSPRAHYNTNPFNLDGPP